MRSDSDIKEDVEAELRWDPDVDPTDIAVAVKDGVVALTGFVRSYSGRRNVEAAVKRIAGVTGVANDLEVRLPGTDERPDPEITRDAATAIRHRLPIASEHIKVIVKDGWVKLEGEVEWNYQREGAEKAIHRVKGIRGVNNLIEVKPRVAPAEVKSQLEEAFRRNAQIDASRVVIEVDGDRIILKGSVRSWLEREEVERAAWAAPGAAKLENQLAISP